MGIGIVRIGIWKEEDKRDVVEIKRIVLRKEEFFIENKKLSCWDISKRCFGDKVLDNVLRERVIKYLFIE